MKRNSIKLFLWGVSLGILLTLGMFLGFIQHFRLNASKGISLLGRAAINQVAKIVFASDLKNRDAIVLGYIHGNQDLSRADTKMGETFALESGKTIRIQSAIGPTFPTTLPEFVYENPTHPALVDLREAFKIDTLIDTTKSDFTNMIRVGAWLGVQWDHGLSKGKIDAWSDAKLILQRAKLGEKFWCEISAKIYVQFASAMGWPARVVSLSQSGYRWEHAVAEVWSNDLAKWAVIDADFNVYFEKDGAPLSAFEICHLGEDSIKVKSIFRKQFAPKKQSLNWEDSLQFFSYAQIDLRNDRFSRPLRPGSPAGGDLNTLWTSRKSIGPIFVLAHREDDQTRFDWVVNTVSIYPKGFKEDSKGSVKGRFELLGYGPYYAGFEIACPNSPWTSIDGNNFQCEWGEKKVEIAARMRLSTFGYGPVRKLVLQAD